MAVFHAAKYGGTSSTSPDSLSRESSKSTSKTVAKNAENQRRSELEQGFNNVQTRRENRLRQLRDVAAESLRCAYTDFRYDSLC
jgi:hypothetical protein